MKKISLIAAFFIVLSLVFTSCQSSDPIPTSTKTSSYADFSLKELEDMLEKPDGYKSIKISKSDFDTAWDESFIIEKQQLLLDYAKKITPDSKDQPAIKAGDLVNIQYSCELINSDYSSDKLSNSSYNVTVGSKNAFIPELEESLLDKKAGQTYQVQLRFSEDHNTKELRGELADFSVKINYIKSVPEYNDHLIRTAFADNEESAVKYSTVKEYEESCKASILSNLAMQKYSSAANVKSYPSSILENEYNRYIETYTSWAANMQLSLDDFVTSNYCYMVTGKSYYSPDEFKTDMMLNAKKSVKDYLLLYYVYRANSSLLDSRVKDEKQRILEIYAHENMITVDQLEDIYDKDALDRLVIEQLTFKYIGECATVE